MSDYPMLISNKLHSFRNFTLQTYSGLMPPNSSQYHPKDGLWTELFHGSKVLEGSVKTTKYFQKLHKP